MKIQRYVAFLRGVNVGGKMVNMSELKQLFETIGFTNVKTVLNSGNVVFESKNETNLRQTIENALEKTFGFPIDVILRSENELATLIQSDPFKNITVTEKIRLYITFLQERHTNDVPIPYEEKGFTILALTKKEVISMVTLSEQWRTTDGMNILEKMFTKKITTRNWNTVLRLLTILNGMVDKRD